MIKNKFGEQVYNIEDVVDLIMSDQNISGITVDQTVTTPVGVDVEFCTQTVEDINVQEYDKRNQQNWLMPDEYKQLDIAAHIIDCCKTDAELQRAAQELLLFQERDLFNLLRYLKYLVDTMKSNSIIWGVGRGSSVASYVLYLLGVHRVNSMYYDLDPTEFLR
jgi:DNA polymerase III alpha subunit